MGKMESLFAKKKKDGKEMSGMEKDAKMSVVHDMKKMAMDAMGDKLKGLKKVSVASNSPEGLQMGLDKAKELVTNHPNSPETDNDDSPENEEEVGETDESPEAAEEHGEMSEDEVDAELKRLMDLKEKMKKA